MQELQPLTLGYLHYSLLTFLHTNNFCFNHKETQKKVRILLRDMLISDNVAIATAIKSQFQDKQRIFYGLPGNPSEDSKLMFTSM